MSRTPSSSTSDLEGVLTSRAMQDQHQLEDHARKLAVRARPEPDATALSACEAALVEDIERRALARADRLDAAAQALSGELADITGNALAVSDTEVRTEIETALKSVFSVAAPAICTAERAERDARAELDSFRDAHDLNNREATYPVSMLRHFASVVVVGLVNCAVDMWLFLNGQGHGLLGAFATAVVAALCNEGVAVAVGFGPARGLHLPKGILRTLSIAGLLIGCATVLILNLMTGHYRELAAQSKGAFNPALVGQHLLTQPFELSPMSWALVVLGLLFAVFSGWKGYRADDPYPGYGRRHRRHADHVDDLAYLRGTIEANLDAVKTGQVATLRTRDEATARRLAALRHGFASLLARAVTADQHNAAEIQSARIAITRFRSLNARIRADGQVPTYFADAVTFGHERTEGEDPTASYTAIGTAIEAAIVAHAETRASRASLRAEALTMVEASKANTAVIMTAIAAAAADEEGVTALTDLWARILAPPSAREPESGPAPSDLGTPSTPIQASEAGDAPLAA